MTENEAPRILTHKDAVNQMSNVRQVYEAISAVSADLAKEGISKSRKNDQQGYRFRGIDEVFNTLAPALVAHGLLILPRMLTRMVNERLTPPTQTKPKGGVLFYVTVEAEFDFVSVKDGSSHTIRTFGEAMDSGDKATNKAMSAAYKYAAFQAFCIPTEGDNDADKTTHEVAAPKAVKTAPRVNSPDEPVITEEQQKRLVSIAKKANRAPAEIKVWLKQTYDVNSSASLKQADYEAACKALEARGPLPLAGDAE